MEELIQFKENDTWLHVQLNNQKFQEEYENKFVAVFDKNIVASADTVERLITQLNKLKVDISKAVVEFIYPKGVAVFF